MKFPLLISLLIFNSTILFGCKTTSHQVFDEDVSLAKAVDVSSCLFNLPDFSYDVEEDSTVRSKLSYVESVFDKLTDNGIFFLKPLGKGTTGGRRNARVGSWKVKVRCGNDDVTVANLKCNLANTVSDSEYAAYAMGELLDFRIYPVTTEPRDLNFDQIAAVDGNGNKISRGHRNYPGSKQRCVIREWLSFFMQYTWKTETFTGGRFSNTSKKKISAGLKCGNTSGPFIFSGSTGIGEGVPNYKKKAYHTGPARSLKSAVRDFSNLMVIDTLIANEDRYPAGNLQFRNVAGEPTSKVETSRGKKRVRARYNTARLFSIDSGGGFKSNTDGDSIVNLKKYVRGFDMNLINKLQTIVDAPAGKYPDLEKLKFRRGTPAFPVMKRRMQKVIDLAKSRKCDL